MPKKSRHPQQQSLPGWDEPRDTVAPVLAEEAEENRGTDVPRSGDSIESPENSFRDTSSLQPPASSLTPPVPQHQTPNTAPLAGKTVWAIDTMSLVFQVFHAVPEMTSPGGQPVNAVFGFTRDMFAILEQKRPDYLFCGFDLSGPTFRHALYEPYKQNRAEMPADLSPQIDTIRRVLAAMEIPILEMPGYEADDVLATLARYVEHHGGECVLVTADKDYRQLITDRVRLYNMRKNQFFDAAALAADWGIRPDQVVDFQTLVGDPVDNIPGVPLIGPKLAQELLAKFDNLENVFAHVHDIPGEKRKQNLIAAREQTIIARKLVKLETHVPVEIPWDAGRCEGFSPQAARELFEELGFHSLTNKMRGEQLRKTPVKLTARYETIATLERLTWLVKELSQQARFSLDTETTHVNPRWAELVGLSFSWLPGEAYYLPVRAPLGEPQLPLADALAALKPVLEDPKIAKLGQNIKYDWIVLRNVGIDLGGVAFDTMVASYLLDAGERNHNLDELAARYLNHKTTTISELIGKGKSQKRMDEVPVELITHYAAEDADIPLRLQPLLQDRLVNAGLDKLNSTLEVPLIEVLVELEFNGIRVDPAQLRQLSGKFTDLLAILEQEIYAMAGHPFNIGSPKQLQEILFNEQKLPILKRNKTGPSTDVEVLEELALEHPLPAKIIEYRQFSKLKNTYVDALPELIHPVTQRVHSSFNQVVAATGRLSSNDPNLQNIPIRTKSGREIRAAFLPDPADWLLIAADYSQIELRVLAHYSNDATMCASFANDEDIHARVASQVFNVPLDGVTSAQRRAAKAVNFGIIYGQSPYGLARALDIDQKEAARFIDAYFAGYPGVEAFMLQVQAECAQQGYVSTILGRRRAITGVKPPNPKLLTLPPSSPQRQKSLPDRTAINTVIQGSAADLIKLAMLAIFRRLRAEGLRTRMLLQIHDELVFESPPEEVEPVSRLILDEMSGVMAMKVPLKVDLKTGKSWAECE